uniref:Glycerophosphodiester phosphodiesterase domain containing 4 n=1 Tax=Chelydra serpentina TaxID=8475 RepID=A0A8C3SNH2_CHESE
MDSGSVSFKKLKFGKLKVVRRHLLQRYEHQPFISCLAGLYSCQWKRYQRRRTEPGQCCCKMVSFCLSLVFLYMWGEAKNDYNNFDWTPDLAQEPNSSDMSFPQGLIYTLSNGVTLAFLFCILSVIQAIIIGPYLAILVLLFLIPLGIYSPCIREVGTLGPKPALIGHRGAPMLAPENTEMSFQKTIEHGGDGLETDVTISYDGIPFLMHDSNLQRTTNIREVFPSNSTQNAALFSWDALEQLNAGKWFLRDTPFSCMGSLSSADQKLAMNQSIYKLSNFLRLADRANKLVIFDLYRPPEKHPYRNTWINTTLEVIRDSGIKPHLVLWLHNTMRSFVQSVAPGFQHTMASKAPVDALLRDNIVKLNLVYSAMSSEDIRKYARANITTNLYVISEPWLFSLAWCVGVHSVTTNAVHSLKNINRPLFLMVREKTSPALWERGTQKTVWGLMFIPAVRQRWRGNRHKLGQCPEWHPCLHGPCGPPQESRFAQALFSPHSSELGTPLPLWMPGGQCIGPPAPVFPEGRGEELVSYLPSLRTSHIGTKGR